MGIPNATSQMLEAQSAAAAISRNVFLDQQHALTQQQKKLKQHYELEIKRLQSDYRWQTKNVEAVEGTASTFAGEMQVAIDIIMESTGKSFEQVKQMIIEHRNIDSYCNKAHTWLKTSPRLENGLISDSRQAVSE